MATTPSKKNIKRTTLINLQNTNQKLKIDQTPYGAGSGVYTTTSISKDDELFIFSENIVPWKQVTHRAIQLGVNRWLEPNKHSYGWFLNHSCNPSAAFKLPNKIVAYKSLKPNEEITIDYSTVIHMNKFEFECLCPNTNCRKIVRSFQFLPQEFQKKFKDLNSLEPISQKVKTKKENKRGVTGI